jgi:hypothetical protein
MFDISEAGGKKGCGEGRDSNGLKPEVSSTGCGFMFHSGMGGS